MIPVILGAGAVLAVVYGIKYLQGRGEHSPEPPHPPPPETTLPDAGAGDAGAPQ